MAAKQQAGASLPLGDTQKVVLALVLTGVLAAIWIPRLAKRKRRPAAAPTAHTVSAPSPLAMSSAEAAAPTAPAAAPKPKTTDRKLADAIVKLSQSIPELPRDPFAVSAALAKLMTEAAPAEPAASAEQTAAEERKEQAAPTLKLQAIVIDGACRYGMINGQIVVEGRQVEGMTVKSIQEREIVLEGPSGAVRLAIE